MRGILVLIGPAACLVMGGCGSSADTAATSTTTTVFMSSTPTSSTPTPAARPTTILTPEGWGAAPPGPVELDAMGAWMDGPGRGGYAAIMDAGEGIDGVNAAADSTNIAALKTACRDISDPLTIRLPPATPAPDADLTNAIDALIADGTDMHNACTNLTDPPTAAQLDALEAAMGQLGDDLRTTGTIMKRNGDIFHSAAEAKR